LIASRVQNEMKPILSYSSNKEIFSIWKFKLITFWNKHLQSSDLIKTL